MATATKNHDRPAATEVKDIESFLASAKRAKKDEFYTQWADIEREMNAYLEYDPDVFRNKVVLLPCDDPEWSNFTKYFALHFMDFGLKKLVSTSFAADSKPGIEYQPTSFELGDPQFDEIKTHVNGKLFTLEAKDLNGDGVINIEDLQWRYLEGDGDFRSDEITRMRDDADIVITNPPFSLFRQFIDWLMVGGVKFSMIGNQNAITYKEVFRLIKANQIWLGRGFPRNMAHFNTPYAPQSKWIEQKGDDVVRVPGVQWFTNIDHGRRHEPLELMTKADNLRYNKKLIKALAGADGYFKYDTYDAIEVPFTAAIPNDYEGVMGVPITFLEKYSPDQFEIIGLSRYVKTRGMSKEFVDAYYASGQTGQISEGHPDLCYYGLNRRPIVPYMRVLIRQRDGR